MKLFNKIVASASLMSLHVAAFAATRAEGAIENATNLLTAVKLLLPLIFFIGGVWYAYQGVMTVIKHFKGDREAKIGSGVGMAVAGVIAAGISGWILMTAEILNIEDEAFSNGVDYSN